MNEQIKETTSLKVRLPGKAKEYCFRLKDEVMDAQRQWLEAKKLGESGKELIEKREKMRKYLAKKKEFIEFLEMDAEKRRQKAEEVEGMGGFEIPARSKRGPLWPKSAENPHATKEPDTGYLLPEVELTPPEQAVKMLEEMYPGLDTKNWEQALRIGIAPAMRACQEMGIDPERLVIFPWIKRKALARLAGLEQGTHYGGLVERAIFPQLEKLYKKRSLGFQNFQAGKMSSDNYLRMENRIKKWLGEREEEVEGDICFSAAIMDMFQGYSVNAGRYETEKEKRIINGTCYVVQQILLTQKQLNTKARELTWNMPGDRYDPDGNSGFSSSLDCFIHAFELKISRANTDDANMHYGSIVFLSDPSTRFASEARRASSG